MEIKDKCKILFQKNRLPTKVAGIHLSAVFVSALIMASGKPDSLYQAIWFPLAIIDFPVSLLVVGIWMLPITSAIQKSMLVFTFPWSDFANFWVPLFVFGIFGTLWWFGLIKLVLYFKQKSRHQTAHGLN